MATISFVTDGDHRGLTTGDAQIADAVRRRGHRVEPWVWDEPRPASCDMAVLRSAWDVWGEPGRLDAFLSVLTDAERAGVLVINDLDTVRWAIDKRTSSHSPATGSTSRRRCCSTIRTGLPT